MTDHKISYNIEQNNGSDHKLISTITQGDLSSSNEKDLVSFYHAFSSQAFFDSGLLPVDGSGVLSIRSAGPHTQVSFQHKPGLYYINWGAYESDSTAQTYLVAQPYRIVVGDFLNGNLQGARTFYSPFPISHPNIPLYHVNLPNINCRGYRGNAVGWICLYHNENWSQYPFGEKVSRLIERCSGIETYNDSNMQETDGPRFYCNHYNQDEEYEFLWNPNQWVKKSEEGYEWTLNEKLWIPIKVNSIDDQRAHSSHPDAIPLTFSMALTGNYAAYYHDDQIPKYYNLFSRPDMDPSSAHVYHMFSRSFTAATVTKYQSNDSYSSSLKIREQKSNQQTIPFDESEEDTDTYVCSSCEETYDGEPEAYTLDSPLCQGCALNHYVWVESLSTWVSSEEQVSNPKESGIIWCETDEMYYHTDYDTVEICKFCETVHAVSGKNNNHKIPIHPVFDPFENDLPETYCSSCIDQVSQEIGYSKVLCYCQKQSVLVPAYSHQTLSYLKTEIDFDQNENDTSLKVNVASTTFCNLCIQEKNKITLCPCGILKSNDAAAIVSCQERKYSYNGNEYVVNSCCQECTTNLQIANDVFVVDFKPFNMAMFDASLTSGLIAQSPCVDQIDEQQVQQPIYY